MDLDLKGKTVVITGGGSNIGRAIALAFAAEGANIVIADIDTEQANRTAATALRAGAGGVQVVRADVSRLDQVREAFRAAAARFGAADVLVNNAGWWGPMKPFVETDPDEWRKCVDINYVGVLNCTRSALELMLPKRSGAIVSISSDASRQGEPGQSVYGGAKAAINAFMKTVAKENGRFGIRCNVVCPGATIAETVDEVGGGSLWREAGYTFTPEQMKRVLKTIPLGKLGRPQDIASAVVFLASPTAAGHLTGQVISVSGGYSMVG